MVAAFKKNITSLLKASLYVVINNDYSDPDLQHKSNMLAEIVVKNGCDIVQYRPKRIRYLKMFKEASLISEVCAHHRVPFIINDHIDLAIEVNADGIHLGQGDISIQHARAILGNDKIIGLTVRSVDEALKAPLHLLDYVSIGGVFPTKSNKLETKLLGLTGLKNVIKVIKNSHPNLPIVSIAGLNETNIADVINCGVDSIAVISAISKVEFPKIACSMIKDVIVSASKKEVQNVS